MSAIRNLFSIYRRDRREERALPYARSGPPSANKCKTISVFQKALEWNIFDFLSHLAMYDADRKDNHVVNNDDDSDCDSDDEQEVENFCVVEEEDVEMTDDTSVSTSEESSTDDSIDSIGAVEPVESVIPSELAMPTPTTEPLPPPQPILEAISPVPPLLPSSSCPDTTAVGVPSSTTEVPVFSSDEDMLDWAKRKADKHEKLNEMDFLGVKKFIEERRRDQDYVPMTFRFSSNLKPTRAVPTYDSSEAISSQQTSAPSTHQSSNSNINESPSEPACRSGFTGSASLPTFTNNVRPRPPRMLKSDPNGPLILRGAGSARVVPGQSRKRPAPSISARPDPVKRRRLFEEMNGRAAAMEAQSVPSSTSNGPATPLRSAIGRHNAAPPVPSPLRNFVSGSQPTASPRQKRRPATNLGTNTSGTSASKTASAAFLEEVIEKATPWPRQPDVVNPYQAALPIGLKVRPMEKKRMSGRRMRIRDGEKEKEERNRIRPEKKELTAKEVIEATVPKGVKRSRPPPGIGETKAISNAAPEASRKAAVEEEEEELAPKKKRRTVTIEEVTDEDDGIGDRLFPIRPTAIIEPREPGHTSRPSPRRASVDVSPNTSPTTKTLPRETQPLKVSSTKEVAAKAPFTREPTSRTHVPKIPVHGIGKSSRPKEPSKLRTSFLPEEDGENEVPKTSSPQPVPIVAMTTPGQPLAEVQEKRDPKEVALRLQLSDLPTFVFKAPPAPVDAKHDNARAAAEKLPVTSLPKYDFSRARSSISNFGLPAVPIPTLKPFDFAAAGFEHKVPGTGGEWQCSLCNLLNPASASEKCQVCDTARSETQKREESASGDNAANNVNGVDSEASSPKPSSKLPANLLPAPATSAVKPFDFTAAGFKPKVTAADGDWQCESCELQNNASAREKCSICEAPRPGFKETAKVEKAEKSPKPVESKVDDSKPVESRVGESKPVESKVVESKPGESKAGGSKAKKVEKAEKAKKTEKTKKPYMNGTSHSSKPQTNGTSSTVKGFDFAAAGLKPPAPLSDGSWICGSCDLQNPATATEKCKVCDAPRFEKKKKKKRVAKSPPIAKPMPPVMPRSLDWAAAGLVPRLMDSSSSRNCGSCSLHAPPAETESCKICDASRS